jgi:hypothetical protein
MSQDPRPRPPGGLVVPVQRDAVFEAYDEHAFRHFLALEQQRAERSGRLVSLLLVDLAPPSRPLTLSAALVDRLFSAFVTAVREMDFVGWYITGSVAGAVLLQDATAGRLPDYGTIGRRVDAVLRKALPRDVGATLRVRVAPCAPAKG